MLNVPLKVKILEQIKQESWPPEGNRRQGILDLGFAECLSGVGGDNKSEGVTVGSSKQMFSGHFLYLLGVRFLDLEGTNLISWPRICSSYGQLK